LCGHSYGGQVAAGVADAIPDRIDSLVYLDAAIPVDGMCVLDVLGHGDDGVAGAVRGISGSWLPALPGSTWNLINPADEAMVDALCTPQPLATFTERLSLTGAYMTIPKKTYILATAWNGQPDPSKYEWTRYDDSWTFREIACGHDVMLDAPEQLAEMLIEAM
jgi:pimeloyl-ACP methyl ester carboxylesterase